MNQLADALASKVSERIAGSGLADRSELRLIFRGPPLSILQETFRLLETRLSESDFAIPVLLLVPSLAVGERNPAVGESGRCDESHLLNLRNSTARPTFVALIPPGQHSNMSVATTTDEFGMRAVSNAGNATFEEWWRDEFLQGLIREGISKAGVAEMHRDGAVALIEYSASAADEIDSDRVSRAGAWSVVSRVFSAAEQAIGLTAEMRLSLACGLPRTASGAIVPKEQIGTLEKIADALAEGFGTGVARMQEEASDEDASSLAEFLVHLREICHLPTAFERAPAAYYAPSGGLELGVATSWWSELTMERWSELLAEESSAVGDITMVCTNGLFPASKGMPVLVEGDVALEFVTKGPTPSNALVTIERTPAGPTGKEVGRVRADEGRAFHDPSPPLHRTPMRYVASADRFKPGAVKVISLNSWAPGIYITCRLASKVTAPKRAKSKRGPELEASLLLPGAGRYELLVFASPGVEVYASAEGNPDDAAERSDAPSSLPVRTVRPRQYQVEVELDGTYQVDLHFSRTVGDAGTSEETCRVVLSVEEVEQEGCRSEFERLIRSNRRDIQPGEARAIVQPNRNARSSSLQDWMLSRDLVARSFLPTVIAEDYVDVWVQPDWSGPLGPVLSNGKFLQDPRPPQGEFVPPAGFVEARQAIASRIRGAEDETGLVESAQLGKWISHDATFRELVESYLGHYQSWLSAEPDVACWVDVVAITSFQKDGRTLSRIPNAVLISPLHPVRLAWQSIAQQMLLEADEAGRPCPAASVLDPDCVPDVLTIALRSPSGMERVQFLAVENSTDYWSVLWNGSQLRELPDRSRQAPFGDGFGITVGGISAGFSAAQVSRAMDDISDLLAAKAILGVAISSAGGTTDACNEGLIGWCADRYQPETPRASRQAVGSRLIEVFDTRDPGSRPDDATIANLSEDTNNGVRWFERQPEGAVPDLGIIAQLDMSEPTIVDVDGRTPVGQGALIRHRIRRQLPGAFISETRQGIPPEPSGDPLSDMLGSSVAAMENLGDRRTGLSFAPNVNAIRDMLEVRNTNFVAASSSAVDPACFVGGWLEGAYLWDYDLPSYSRRAGDTNGYYLLSKIKEADREALARALGRLPGCASLTPEQVQDVLLEVARRGIPTIRGLSGEDSGATGDLGLFLAVRLLQDKFRVSTDLESLLPVIGGTSDDVRVALVVPVDPFRSYLSDIAKTVGNGKEAALARPDLLVVGARITGEKVRIHLTPIEVKCRPGSTFPMTDVSDAIDQAQSLSRLLSAMLPHDGQPKVWELAFQHLLLSIIGFGMRVYSQRLDEVGQQDWMIFHERIASAILGQSCPVTVDKRGRLVVVDDSVRSAARDHDGDGFDETITIGTGDAGRMVTGNTASFYDSVRAKVGDWELLPPDDEQSRSVSVVDKPRSNGDAEAPVEADERPAAARPASQVALEVPPVDGAQLAEIKPEELSSGVVLRVGRSVDGFEPREIFLNIADTRLNHLNMGVVGDLGTGKTQLLKSLITQITNSARANRGIRPRFLIFDYKRDYSSSDFIAATGARIVRPERLPINLFDTSMMEGATAPWLHRYRFFADVLDKIYSGIGPVQRDRMKRAIRGAYEASLPGRPPTLYDVHLAYGELIEGKPDSISAIIEDLVDMEVFSRDVEATTSFNDFFDGVVVISLDALGQDDRSKNMLVAIMLNLFYENMLRTPKRPFVGEDPKLRAIDSYLLVDEADNIMQYEFDVLKKLLLQGREFGTGIILASQYLRHFKVNGTDYREPLLTWFLHKVPNVSSSELSALGLTGSLGDLAERVKSLQNHQCLYKSFDVPGEVIRGLPFFELTSGKV